jgi:hypothetical protein
MLKKLPSKFSYTNVTLIWTFIIYTFKMKMTNFNIFEDQLYIIDKYIITR